MPIVIWWALGGLGIGSVFGFSLSDGFQRMINVLIVLALLTVAFQMWKKYR